MKSLFTSNRRVRICQYALFGVFIFYFTAVLHAEDLLLIALRCFPEITTKHLLAHPQAIGTCSTLFLLPIIIGTNENWHWLSRLGSTLRQFVAIFLGFFIIGIIIPSDEQTNLERQTARLYAIGLHEKAFEVGHNYPFTTPRLQVLRQQALSANNQLGQHLFEGTLYYFPPAIRHQALKQLSIPVTVGGLRYLDTTKFQSEQPYISALLDGNLSLFATTLPRKYLSLKNSSQVPLYYRQALLLYMRQTTRPILYFADDATETNYRDFLDQQCKLRLQYPPDSRHNYSISEKNKMNFFYGNTYWYYYFYEIPQK